HSFQTGERRTVPSRRYVARTATSGSSSRSPRSSGFSPLRTHRVFHVRQRLGAGRRRGKRVGFLGGLEGSAAFSYLSSSGLQTLERGSSWTHTTTFSTFTCSRSSSGSARRQFSPSASSSFAARESSYTHCRGGASPARLAACSRSRSSAFSALART